MSSVAPLGPVYQAGTLSGNPVTVSAGIKTLEILRDHPQIYTDIEQKAAKIAEAFRTAFAGRAGANQVGSLLTFFFTDSEVHTYGDVVQCDTKAFADFFHQMLRRGFYIPPSQYEALFLSAAHSAADVDAFIEAIEEVAEIM